MFAIRHLTDVATQRVFADFGAFMLERTVKSFAAFDDSVIDGLQRAGPFPMENLMAHGSDRRCGKIAKLVDLETRLNSLATMQR
jgi:hypothetical protein